MKRALIAATMLALLMSVSAMWIASAEAPPAGGASADGSGVTSAIYVYGLDEEAHLNFNNKAKLSLTFFGVRDRGVSVRLDGRLLSSGERFNDPVSSLMFPRYGIAKTALRKGKGADVELVYSGDKQPFWTGTLFSDGKDAAPDEVEFRAVRLDAGRSIAQTSARIAGETCPNAKVRLYALSALETASVSAAQDVPPTPDASATAAPDTSAIIAPDTSVAISPDASATAAPDASASATPDAFVTVAPDTSGTVAPDTSATPAPDAPATTLPDGGEAGVDGFATENFGLDKYQAVFLKEADAGDDGRFELTDLDLRDVKAVALVVQDPKGTLWMEYQEVLPLTVDSTDILEGDMAVLHGTGKPGESVFIWDAKETPYEQAIREDGDGRWSYNIPGASQVEDVRVGYDGGSKDDWRAFKLADLIGAGQKGVDAQDLTAGTTTGASAGMNGQAQGKKPRATIGVDPKPVNEYITGDSKTLRFYGEAQPGSGLKLTVGAVTQAVSAGGDGKWEIAVPLSELPTGELLTPGIAYADGTGQGQSLVSFTIDTGCLLAFDGALVKGVPSIAGTADPGAAVTLYQKDAAVSRTVANAGGGWVMSLKTSSLVAGESMMLKAVDKAGNEAAPVTLLVAEALREQITFATEPKANAAGLISGPGKAIRVSGAASPGEAVEVTAEAASLAQPVRLNALPGESGGWTCDIILDGMKDGDRVTLSAAYADGMSASKKTKVEFAFDTAAPEIAPDLPLDASMATLNGKTEAGTTVRLTRDGQPPISAVADASGAFAFDQLTLKEGETLTLEAEDGAGNTGTAAVRVDPAPPVAFGSITVDKPTSEGRDTTVSGWFLMSEPGRVYLSLYDQSVKIREELLEGGSPMDTAGIKTRAGSLDAARAGRLTAGVSYEEQPIRTGDLKQGTYQLRLTAVNDVGEVIGGTSADAQLVIEPRPDFLPQKLFILTALFVLALGLVFWYVRAGKRLRQMENAVIDRVNRDSALTIKMRGKTQ